MLCLQFQDWSDCRTELLPGARKGQAQCHPMRSFLRWTPKKTASKSVSRECSRCSSAVCPKMIWPFIRYGVFLVYIFFFHGAAGAFSRFLPGRYATSAPERRAPSGASNVLRPASSVERSLKSGSCEVKSIVRYTCFGFRIEFVLQSPGAI